MSRLGALGGARAGLALLLGSAAGLGFLCMLYRQRWKRTQRHGGNQSLPNSLDYAQTSEPGRQGKEPETEVNLLTDRPRVLAAFGRTCGTGSGGGCLMVNFLGKKPKQNKRHLPFLYSFLYNSRKVYCEKII